MLLNGRSRGDNETFLRETEFLLRLMPGLEAVRGKTRGWDAFGVIVSTQMERDWGIPQGAGQSLWLRAKQVVHSAMTGSDARHEAIQARIRRSPEISAIMLADLSLWLAGEMGVSISVTKRLVAVMLIGLAESKGAWHTLAG